jgi:hypothetical protein
MEQLLHRGTNLRIFEASFSPLRIEKIADKIKGWLNDPRPMSSML